jgi:hypothetical protein
MCASSDGVAIERASNSAGRSVVAIIAASPSPTLYLTRAMDSRT